MSKNYFYFYSTVVACLISFFCVFTANSIHGQGVIISVTGPTDPSSQWDGGLLVNEYMLGILGKGSEMTNGILGFTNFGKAGNDGHVPSIPD
jgi:hypothetical protein